MSAPRCRYCQKPLAKKTETVNFWHNQEDAPRSLAECRQRTNLPVVSVAYWHDGKVRHFSTWDGESYESRFAYFCTVTCAAKFGRRMADKGARI